MSERFVKVGADVKDGDLVRIKADGTAERVEPVATDDVLRQLRAMADEYNRNQPKIHMCQPCQRPHYYYHWTAPSVLSGTMATTTSASANAWSSWANDGNEGKA